MTINYVHIPVIGNYINNYENNIKNNTTNLLSSNQILKT